MSIPVWLAALLTYGVFWFWYVGVPRPLTGAEIDAHLETVAASKLVESPEKLATLRAFLEADDGGEFFMLNLIRPHQGEVVGPNDSEPRKASEVLDGYTSHFMPALLRRAGHPAFYGRAAAPYLEEWNVAPDPGWKIAAAIRYRSRRDMIELVTDPRFADAHLFKSAGIESTLAFPTAPAMVVIGPKIWVGLVLALLAALAQIGIRALRS